jgi:hypothetical protein
MKSVTDQQLKSEKSPEEFEEISKSLSYSFKAMKDMRRGMHWLEKINSELDTALGEIKPAQEV